MDHSLEIERLMRGAQQRIMADIVRRIRINQNITRTADWQIDRLTQLGDSKKEVRRILQEQLGLTADEIEALYKEAAESGYARSEELYKAIGRDYIPPAENAALQQLISSAAKQTGEELRNLTRSLGFAVNQGGKLKFKGIAKYYQDTLDGAVADISSGAFDYNTVINRVIAEMTNSGLRTVDYATGRHNRIDVAARRAVMTGMNQLTGKVQEDNADKLGTDKFEVSWHGTARPEHQEWQGKVYTKEQLESVCGLGSVTGLLGANCRHTYFPFIEGVSERIYTDEQLRAMNERENEPKYYNGKPYTAYEATQRQRYLETSMRAQRQKIKLLEEAGVDEQDITLAKCKYRRLSQEYTAFSKQMGLPQERDRIYADGLGKSNAKVSGISEKYLQNSKNDDKINLKKPYLKIKTEEIPSMNRERFLKIKNNLQSRGISIIQDKDGDAFLTAMNAEAMTLSDGSAIIFKSGTIPSASAMFEEIIHVTQIKNNGALITYGTEDATKEYLRREIEANEKVLRYAKAYGLTDKDIESTSRNLENYNKQWNEVNADV